MNQRLVKLLDIIMLLFLLGAAYAHSELRSTKTTGAINVQISTVNKDTIFSFVEKMPEFPGGKDSMFRFLEKNLKYPYEAYQKRISGKVYVQFVVNKEGKIGHIKVIKGIDGGCKEEVVRLVKLFPDWIPGQMRGKPVSAYFTMPIIFTYEEPANFVDEIPEFPGGLDALMRFIYSKLRYPEIATNVKISGRVLLVFVVDKNGKAMDIRILRGIGAGCDEEAIRIVRSFPNWSPGKLNGKSVPVCFALPIIFTLEKDADFKLIYEKTKHLLKNLNEGGFSLSKFREKKPEYPGGNDSLSKFISRSIKYPKEANEKKIGKSVFVGFTVKKDGVIRNVKVLKEVNPLLDAEALRIVNSFPNWNPGLIKGEPFDFDCTIEVSFDPGYYDVVNEETTKEKLDTLKSKIEMNTLRDAP